MPWPPDSIDPAAASRVHAWFRLHVPNLKWRRVLYLIIAIPSAIIWFPVSVLGLGFIVGAIGIIALPVLIRCIVKLPADSDRARKYYGALIFLGVVALGVLLVAYLASGGEVVVLVVVSGIGLLFVGCAVLVELIVSRSGKNQLQGVTHDDR